MRTALLLVALLSVSAGAQSPSLRPGMRVRVQYDQIPDALTGSVLARTPDTLVVERAGLAPASIPTASIRRLSVSGGVTRGAGAGKGARIGAILGGSLGLVLGLALSSDYEAESLSLLTATSAFASAGALWGMGIGALVRAEKWTTVYVRVPAGSAIIRE
jgi:hypothetical protein